MSGNGRAMSSLVRIEQDGWRLTITKEFHSAEESIKTILRLSDGELVPFRRSRRARTFLVQFASGEEDQDVFVKYFDPPDAWQRLKSCWRASRSSRTARMTTALRAAGFSVPPVLLYGVDRNSNRELVVTARARGDGPILALRALAGSIAAKRGILRALGREIGRLHLAGFIHGDLTPFNLRIVLDEPRRFAFIDNDRTRRTPVLARNHQRLRNLVQLGRFALPGITRTDRMRVFRAYEKAVYRCHSRSLERRVAAMLQRRMQRDPGALPCMR